MAKIIKQAIMTVKVFRYDTPEEQAEHAVKMQAQGWNATFIGKYYLGESRADEFVKEDNWHLVTEFSNLLKEEEPSTGSRYEIQTRIY